MTGAEIRARLAAFAARWSVYAGSERAEAQTFCNELFACYGQDRMAVGAVFEDPQHGRFLDLIWRPHCIIEMKRPSEAARLPDHRPQSLGYWSRSSDAALGLTAPRYVVLCAFHKLEIWEPGRFPSQPRVRLDLVDLPEQYDALLFLAGAEPVFTGGHVSVTRDAVAHLTGLYQQLTERDAAAPDALRDFLLQSVWCLFAEDLAQIPEHRFMRTVEDLVEHPSRSSADDLHQLFEALNTPGVARPPHGIGKDVPYANGGLFERPARVHLNVEELRELRAAAEFSWREVEPAIFGSLLEGALGRDRQWALGAHYTHEADIQKVVQPTIVEPWRDRIESITTLIEAQDAQAALMQYVVLDPACGSGNFLYVAYRELRRLEHRLRAREQEIRDATGASKRGPQQAIGGLFFPISNLRGIEIEAFAVQLARVTLWMGHKLAVEELSLDEATLPLADLSGIQAADALRIRWPRADAIIGNPPFHGSQFLRRVLGDNYVDWLSKTYGVGVKDLCTYWFRKAHDQLQPGQRAGLVGTNSISQNRARSASLDYIVDNGGVITSAVSKQPWPGTAVVNVSIVNWTKIPTNAADLVMLDGAPVAEISSSLRGPGSVSGQGGRLRQNAGRSFQGPKPVGRAFVIKADEAAAILALDTAYRDVVRPYLIGKDLTDSIDQSPSRWCIDFGTRSLEDAQAYPAALQKLREGVRAEDPARIISRKVRKPDGTAGKDLAWWRFERPRPEMRAALASLSRYIAGTATGKRVFFAWQEPWTCPSNATNVFAFDNDYHFGMLCSSIHTHWAEAQWSTMRTDPRYTPTSIFEKFPFPYPINAAATGLVEKAGRALEERRRALCLKHEIGLTKLYNLRDEGAFTDLQRKQEELDEAVATAYGWPRTAAHDAVEANTLLLELNRAITAGEVNYRPFG